MRRLFRTLLLGASVAASTCCAGAAALYDGEDGASCDYFNLGARIRWTNRVGDWIDANGTVQGPVPFAQTPVADAGGARTVQWDVTKLVAAWFARQYPEQGVLVRVVPGAPQGAVSFYSRESDVPGSRPKLILDFADSRQLTLSATADTHLDCTTVTSLGTRKFLSVSNETNVLLSFDLNSGANRSVLTKATLEMTSPKQFSATVLGVYRLALPSADSSPVELGLAARYPRDRGIEKDPSVVMASGFESPLWWSDWSDVSFRSNSDRVAGDSSFGFEPLDGNALRVRIPRGKNLGLDMAYKFADKLGNEPEEIYFRYYLRLGNDWNPTTEGGKLPGISGTYGRAGWGGRTSDGTNGWSMRGSFLRLPTQGNPYHARTPIGTYAYHADTEDFWGDMWVWSLGQNGLLERNRWYCIEQYVKINVPGKKDAVMRAWIDGRLALNRTGFRVRTVPSLKIEEIWMNVYYGGTAPSPQDQHLFIDNVVIARQYIGPMQQ